MAKKISSSDLFSQEDLFKGVRDSAQAALVMINQLNAAMKTSAEGLKASIKGADLGSASGLKGFNQAASEANQLKEEAIRLEIMQKKLTAEMEAAEKSRIATERERLKLENDLAKAAARAAKTDADKDSAYKALVKSTRDLKNASKELAAQLLVLEKSGQSGTDEFKNLSKQYDEVTKSASDADQQLKEIDKSVGDSFRNVGNYEGAVEGMAKGFTSAKAELRALTNEILNMKRGTPEFDAATKRASELKDEIQDLSQELSAGAGNAFEQVAGGARLFGQRILDLDLKGAGTALAGMGAAVRKIDFKTVKEELGGLAKGMLNLGASVVSNPFFLIVGVLAAIAYNYKDIAKWANQSSLEQQNLSKVTEDLNKATEQELMQSAEKIAQLEILTKRVNDNNLTEKERRQALEDLETMYPAYFSNINGDINDTEALNAAKEKLITNIKAEAKANAAKSLLEAEYAKKIALEQELASKKGKLSLEEFNAAVEAAKFNQQTYFKDANQNLSDWWNGTEGIGEAAVKLEESIQRIAYLENEATSAVLANVKTEVKAIRDKTKAAKTSAQTKREKEEAERQKEIDDYNKAQEEISAILEKWDEERIAAEKKLAEDKLKVEQDYARARQSEQANELYELELKKTEELAVWEEGSKERILIEDKYRILEQAVNDKYDAMALAKQVEDDAKKKALAEKAKDDAKKIEIEKQKELNDAVKAGTDLFVQQSERKQAQVQKDLDNAKKQYDTLKALADSGNIDAQQSLAEQQRIVDEKERQRMAEMKRQERIKLAQSIFSTYSAKLESGDKNALANTIKDATVLTQFVQSLPAFLKGTEDTGVNGYGVDGKGGFLSVLHPNERVVPKELNSKMSGITNEELAKIAVAYKTNEFMTSIPAFEQTHSSEVVNELKSLKRAIEQKPETNISLGEIMQGAMEIVQTTKRGNKTVYNRYRVK